MQWQQFYGQWTNPGTYTRVQLSIEVDVSQTSCSSGGDFAFDDISFINGCQNLTSLRVPTFPSDTLNLCTTSGSLNLTATYTGDPNPSNNIITWYKGSTSPQAEIATGTLTLNNITEPDIYRICITDPDNTPGNCPVSATVVVQKQLNVTLPPTTLCSPPVANITANVSPVGTYTKNYTWTVPSGVTDPGNNATVAANMAGNYSVTVTNPDISGCSGSANVNVTSLLPTYDPSKIQPLCYGATNQTITGLGTGANVANYKWYTTATGGTAFSTGASPTIPGPLPTSGSSYTIYLEDATTTPIAGSPIVPNGTTQGVATYSQSLTVHQSIQLVSVQATPTPWTGPCAAAAGTYNYRVELTNAAGTTVLQYRDVSMNCGSNTAQTLTLNFNISPGSYQLRIRNEGGAAPTGWYNYYNSNGTYSIPGYLDVTDGNNFGAPFGRYTIVKTNGCDRLPINIPLQDCCTPATITTQPANTSVCPNTAASFNVVATGTGTLSYQWQSDNGTSGATWTNVATATNATLNIPAASVTSDIDGYRYRVIVRLNNSCPDTSNVATLTVRPLPNITSSTTESVCSGTAFEYTPTSDIANSTFSWTRAAVTGISNPAVTNGTGDINETLINTTSSNVNVVYSIKAESPDGCEGPAKNVTVTVYPTPKVTSSLTGAICSGEAFNYTITGNVAGSQLAWSRAGLASIDEAAASGVNAISETLTNNTGSPVNVVYVLTPTGPAPGNCAGPDSLLIVTVNPKPVITSVTSDKVCSGVEFNYTITSNVSNPSFSWTRNFVAGISPSDSSNTTNQIRETLINSTSGSVNVIYRLEVTSAAAEGACEGDPEDLVVEVLPAATVTSPLTDEICSGSTFEYEITANLPNSTFTWERGADAYNSASGVVNGANISEVLNNT
ncbi:MAG TPA: PKD-like domain-containing protein, partial [Cytophagaceae bacterium]